jgi:hypothetical protein
LFAFEILPADWKKDVANLWSRTRITKKAHAGHGQESKWEMSTQYVQDAASD